MPMRPDGLSKLKKNGGSFAGSSTRLPCSDLNKGLQS